MATVNFNEINTTGTQQSNNTFKVQFFPKVNDGEEIIVRFPYKSSDEFDLLTVHTVNVNGYDRQVSCLRNGREPLEKCPLCSHGPTFDGKFGPVESSKIRTRFYVKVITYTKDANGNIVATPTIWDRPMGFAQELNTLMQEYGPLKDVIFKMKRTGQKKDTRYTIMYGNPAIYRNELYPDISAEYDGYNVLGTMVMNKTADDMNAYIVTGKFPEVVRESQNESSTVKNDELPFTMNEPEQITMNFDGVNPTETVSRPVRYY